MNPAGPHSAQFYFEKLLEVGEAAGASGDYAIAAALAVRCDGTELVAFGRNTVFSASDPSGHAEMNAIDLARRIGAARPDRESLAAHPDVLLRDAPSGAPESILFATLEPCPMCSVCIVNAGIDRVVIGAPDPPSGTLLDGRLEALPEVWPRLAHGRGLARELCQSDDPARAGTYLPAELLDRLTTMFTRSRRGLDDQLEAHGVLAAGDICAAARG